VAGALPQAVWNFINNSYDFTPANNGETFGLVDTNSTTTPITLTFNASDSWYDDVDPASITNVNAILCNGIIKSNPGATPGFNGNPGVEYFRFNNVPEGQYNLYVYLTMNGDGVWADVADNDNQTTYYVKEWHQFVNSTTFVQATNTDPNGVRDTGNYVKLTNLGTYGRGTIGAYVTRRGTAGDGTGVPAIQLVPAGPPQANTTPLSWLIEPVSRRGANGYSNVTFSALIKGPVFNYQWYLNGTAVPGETNISYTPNITAADVGAQVKLIATNNLTTLTSSNCVLTVGQFITNIVGTATNVTLDGAVVAITQQPHNATAIAGGRGGVPAFTVAGATVGIIGDSSVGPPAVVYPFALAASLPASTYQWQSAPKGSSSFTSIGGATGASFIPPVPTLADDGTQFRAIVKASDATSNSAIAVLTVLPNTNPPVAISAVAFNGTTQVGMNFDEALDPVTSQTAGNWKVNGVTVTAAILRTNVANELTSEQNLIQLYTASPIAGNFTVTISGVRDVTGNTIPAGTTVNGKVLGLTATDIGSTFDSAQVGNPDGTNALGVVAPDPQLPNQVTTWGDGNFDVLAQGNDYWNNADGFGFLWEPKTNSFDVRVQVVSVQGINNWSAGALEVREGPVTPNGGGWELARHYFCKVDYGGPTATADSSGSGANTYEFNCRLAPGNPYLRERGGAQGSNNGATNTAGFSYGWGGSGPGNPSPVPFPNAWIRIARVRSVSNGATNDHMLGYSGTDGVNWSLRQDVDLMDSAHAGWLDITGKPAGPLSDVLYVGLGSTSHTGEGNGNATSAATGLPYQCWVVYRNFGDTPTSAPTPTVSIQHNADGSISIAYTGNLYSSTTVNGTYTLMPSAPNPYKVTTPSTGPATTFYRAGP
jgi:hypothetical protein